MPSSPSPRRIAFVILVVLLSGVIWLVAWQLAHALLDFTRLKTGVTLVYVPAGVRLVILLIAGLWGAIGLVLVFPLTMLQELPDLSWPEMLAYSAIAGFVPYLAVLAVCRLAKVSRDLASLRPIHLPLLAAAVSIAGALAFSLALLAFGRFNAGSFLTDVTGMAAGDFLGCFAVMLMVRLATSRKGKPK